MDYAGLTMLGWVPSSVAARAGGSARRSLPSLLLASAGPASRLSRVYCADPGTPWRCGCLERRQWQQRSTHGASYTMPEQLQAVQQEDMQHQHEKQRR